MKRIYLDFFKETKIILYLSNTLDPLSTRCVTKKLNKDTMKFILEWIYVL